MKKINRFYSFLLMAVIVLNFAGLSFAEGDSVTPETRTSKDKPSLSIENKRIPVANAGDSLNISFDIKNSGRNSANNIKIIASPSGDAPFSINSLTGSSTIRRLRPNDRESSGLAISVRNDAKEGIYPIDLKLEYDFENEVYDKNSGKTLDTIPETSSLTETIYLRVNNYNKLPSLIIKDASTSLGNLYPGSTTDLLIEVENKGNTEVTDLEISLDNLNASEGFFVSKGSNKKFLNKIKSFSSDSVKYQVKASSSAALGGHELIVNLRYKFNNEIIEDKQSIFLNIGKKSGKNAKLSIEGLKYSTSPIKPGQDFNISFDLFNSGYLDAKNVIVKVESTSPEAVVAKSQSIRKINLLKREERVKFNFTMMPTRESQTMNYPINIIVEYEDELNEGKDNKYVVNQFAGILVSNPPKPEPKPDKPKPEQPQHKPKLIIDKYTIDPVMVMAGEDFTMNLSFFNTNEKKAVKNIKIFLTSDEKTAEDASGGGNSAFTPVDTSNTFYIDSIPPKGRVEKSIKMFAMPDAKAKTYTITANFEYEDAKAQEFTATELIGVPVIQKSRLDLGQFDIPSEIYQNEASPINVEFFNTGKVTLYNLMVRLEGDFQKENGNYYVGNFEVGNSDSFDASIIADKEGELKGEIVFTYEDASGELIERREAFTSNVLPGFIDEGGDDFPMEPEEGKFKRLIKNKWLWIGLIALIGGFSGFKYYKRKKADDFIEDDQGIDGDE